MRDNTQNHSTPNCSLLHSFAVDKTSFAFIREQLQAIENQASANSNTDLLPLLVTMEKSQPDKVCRFEHIAGTNPAIQRWEAEHIRPMMEAIVGQKLYLFKDKLNLKLPGGGAFGCHQDYTAYQHFKPRQYFTAMIAVDPMTEENGCLEFATNFSSIATQNNLETSPSNETLFPVSLDPSNYGDIIPEVTRAFEWQKIQLSPSEGLVFDSIVPHQSSINMSKHARRALFLTYNPAIYGDHYAAYYEKKINNPHDPIFHVSTPTHRVETQA